MGKSNTLCALDIGSSKIMAILAKQDPAELNITVLAGVQVACRGLRGGVVVNIPETARAVAQAIEICEEKVKDADLAPVNEVILAVRGSHIQSFNNKGAFNIARTDKEITAADVESVLDIAQAVPMSQDREVLHVVAQDFWVDRQKGVPNPVGMEGSLLEADVHILTATASHLNNVAKAVGQAGFRVSRIVYGLYALGEAAVTQEEKEQGCLLLDFGGQTLGIGVYSEGALRHSKEMSLGSDSLTRDLAYALRTSLVNAERLKEEHGACLTSLISPDEEVEFHAIDGREIRRVKKRTLVEIIQPRIEEIFAMVAKELETSGWLEVIVPGGAILTGGGSQMRGLVEASMELLGVPSRIGLPQFQAVTVAGELTGNPSFATALSLLQFIQQPPLWTDKAGSRGRSGIDLGLGAKSRKGLTRKFTNFLEELFS
ncbi:MAG: cell division protein FtsA [Elusimicrobia bacterium]|nr:cell division protein FtsA [Elusimicrobiota bacterium]